jgi:outer membrane protein assembly factor BamB
MILGLLRPATLISALRRSSSIRLRAHRSRQRTTRTARSTYGIPSGCLRGPLVSIPLGDGVAAFVGSPGWSDSQQTIYAAQSVIRDDSNQKVGKGITAWHADQGRGFRPIWSRPLGDGNQATPLVVGGNTVFATGGRPEGFYALRAGTGDLLWSYAPKGRTIAAMISVAGGVFGADTAGVLYAFEPIRTPRGSGSASRFPN